MFYATLNKELVLCDSNNKKCYMYDFTLIFNNLSKLIIEFNGHVFHANENLSITERENWSHPFSKESFDIVLARDTDKKNRALENGFNFIEVWDTQSKDEIINYIKAKIYELHK